MVGTGRSACAAHIASTLVWAALSAGAMSEDAHAQEPALCDNPNAACSSKVSHDCLLKLGAGALTLDDEGGADDADGCRARLAAFRTCLEEVAASCDSGPKTAEPSQDDFAIIDRAMELRPKGDIGQVAAISSQVRSGVSFAGFDFSGLSLRGLEAPDGDFAEAKLNGVDLRHANIAGAAFRAARSDFARFEDANLGGVDAKEARFYFSDLGRADLSGAELQRSNWFGADARGVDFSGADLSNAAFVATDLSGANFAGANLTGAIFQASTVVDAVFDDAVFAKTDLSGVAGDIDQLPSEAHGGVCARWTFEPHYTVRLMRWRSDPSARSGGRTTALREFNFPSGYGGAALIDQRCGPAEVTPAGRKVLSRPEAGYYLNSSTSFSYSDRLLKTIGRGRMETRVASWASHMQATRAVAPRIVLHGEAHAALMAGFDAAITAAKPPKSLLLDDEALFLYVLGAEPSRAETIDWRRRATLAAARRRKQKQRWGAFFPEPFDPQELNQEVVEKFKAWTMALARQMPREFRFRRSLLSAKSLEAFLTDEGRSIALLKPWTPGLVSDGGWAWPTGLRVEGVKSYFGLVDPDAYVVPFNGERRDLRARSTGLSVNGAFEVERIETKLVGEDLELIFVGRITRASLQRGRSALQHGQYRKP